MTSQANNPYSDRWKIWEQVRDGITVHHWTVELDLLKQDIEALEGGEPDEPKIRELLKDACEMRMSYIGELLTAFEEKGGYYLSIGDLWEFTKGYDSAIEDLQALKEDATCGSPCHV